MYVAGKTDSENQLQTFGSAVVFFLFLTFNIVLKAIGD